MTVAHINAIGTALPPHQVHDSFVAFVRQTLQAPTAIRLFDRMEGLSGIERRYSFLCPDKLPDGTITDVERFYGPGEWPTTARRMQAYAQWAPGLAIRAIEGLNKDIADEDITHLVVASCTGFMAPGLDQQIIAATGLKPGIERTVVGFMGCYAAVNSLRLAHHFVRSEPSARVLVVNLELCSIHFQRTQDIGKLLAMLLFGDGASAALVTADPVGIALCDFRSTAISDSSDAITWDIGDQGFDMHLDGRVPSLIANALRRDLERNDAGGVLRGQSPADFRHWAVHAGGRTILDAVERAFALPADALKPSREVLRQYGNMSSATLMFVLASMMAGLKKVDTGADGLAMAFGPGLAAETFRFRMIGP